MGELVMDFYEDKSTWEVTVYHNVKDSNTHEIVKTIADVYIVTNATFREAQSLFDEQESKVVVPISEETYEETEGFYLEEGCRDVNPYIFTKDYRRLKKLCSIKHEGILAIRESEILTNPNILSDWHWQLVIKALTTNLEDIECL